MRVDQDLYFICYVGFFVEKCVNLRVLDHFKTSVENYSKYKVGFQDKVIEFFILDDNNLPRCGVWSEYMET